MIDYRAIEYLVEEGFTVTINPHCYFAVGASLPQVKAVKGDGREHKRLGEFTMGHALGIAEAQTLRFRDAGAGRCIGAQDGDGRSSGAVDHLAGLSL